MKRRHFIIPDTQVKPGVPLDHFRWLGQAIKEYEPDRLIHLGDHWDFHSISSHSEKGSLDKETARVQEDIDAGNKALEMLHESMGGFVPKSKHILRGNHEDRLSRFINNNPVLEGAIGFHNLNDKQLGWTPVAYSNGSPQSVELDGVSYAHYFANPNTGRPIGGSAGYKLNAIGSPFVQGHVQGYDIGTKQYATGRTVRGIVAGSCYLHDEPYKGMANAHWRGALVLNEVERGEFSEMPLTLDYLCRKYEGMSLARFMQRKYRNAKEKYSVAR